MHYNLRPCLFCDGTVVDVVVTKNTGARVECECGACGPLFGINGETWNTDEECAESAAKSWNERRL